eukprot:g444.t1
MLHAKRGYELFFDMANNRSREDNFTVLGKPGTNTFRFEYEFIWEEDNSDSKEHSKQVTKLIEEKKVHFLGGSHPAYAKEQTRQSNNANLLDFYCCVGPDSIYEQDFKKVFGMPASNVQYTRMTMQRLSLEGLRKVWIIADEGDLFSNTTCGAAYNFSFEFAASTNPYNDTEYKTFTESDMDPDFFIKIAQDAKETKVEAIIGCMMQDRGTELVNAIHDASYPLKALFLTGGPTAQEWVDEFDPKYRAENILSAAQWHKDMKYPDTFFKEHANYTTSYKEKFNGLEPTHVSAMASATGLTLHYAIKATFESCDISGTNGDVDALLYNPSAISCEDNLNITGYDRVLQSLAATNIEIFFGAVRFNKYRRNTGLVPVTTQVLPSESDSSKQSNLEIKAVLPFNYATTLLQFPAKNYYVEHCKPGSHVGPDSFDRCHECEKGTVSSSYDSKGCDSCSLGEYMDKLGQSECHTCPDGTTTFSRGSISLSNCTCRTNYYNPSGQSGEICYPCPDGAECTGGTALPFPKEGHWMNFTHRSHSYPCDPADLCEGGPELKCRKGNTGRLCEECDNRYFHIIDHCYRCPSGTVIVFCIIGLLVGWYVLNVIVSRNVASLELLLGWAQLANIIGDVDLRWTQMLSRLFGVANLLDFDVDILEPSCLIENWGFKQNFIVQLCLPFVMSMMAGIGYFSSFLFFHLNDKNIYHLPARARKILSWFIAVPETEEELEKKWDLTVATFLASVDITYVTVAKYCFDVFSCESISDVSVLRSAPEVECNNSDHSLLIALSSIGIVLYVLGYFACASWIVYDLKRKKSFCEEKNIRRYGFIYQKFELEYYYTPIIIILRKLLFVLVLVYLNDPAFQIGALAIIINTSLMIHVYTAPYVDTYIDVLFSFLLVALMFESFGGLMFYSDNLPQDNRTILEWIVMATFFLLVFVFIIIFVMEMTNKYHVLQIKKIHKNLALGRQKSRGNDGFGFKPSSSSLTTKGLFEKAVSLAASVRRKEDLGISFELLDTFKPSFINKCMQKDHEFVQEWDKLTNMLEVYMSDQSPTSYLSIEQNAKFWRKMVDRFPEIVDYLAVVDEDRREQFKTFAQNLYKDFYLTKKVVSLPLMKILNWRDRAPMAHWLTTASKKDREFFLQTVSRMYRVVGEEITANILDAKMEHGGLDPDLESRFDSERMSGKRRATLSRITAGSSPLEHPALNVANAATVALGIQRFKQVSMRGRRQKNIEMSPPADMQPSTSTLQLVVDKQPENTNEQKISTDSLSPVEAKTDEEHGNPTTKTPAFVKTCSANSDFKNNKTNSWNV